MTAADTESGPSPALARQDTCHRHHHHHHPLPRLRLRPPEKETTTTTSTNTGGGGGGGGGGFVPPQAPPAPPRPVSNFQGVGQLFQPLTRNSTLGRVWRLIESSQRWLFYDPNPQFAPFNTLRTINLASDPPAVVIVQVSRNQQFRGVPLYAGWNFVPVTASPLAAQPGSRDAAGLAVVPPAGRQRRAAAGLVAGQPDTGVEVLRSGPGLRGVQHADDHRFGRQPAGGAGRRSEPPGGVPGANPVPWLELRRYEVDRGSFRSCLPPDD